jgi:hypothetical protein
MTKELEWTLILDFYKGFRYSILLDPALRYDGDLKAKILRCLEDNLVSPLPNPKDLRLSTPSGEIISSEDLLQRTLSGYFPEDENGSSGRVIHVGRVGTFLGRGKKAAKEYLDSVRWKVDL